MDKKQNIKIFWEKKKNWNKKKKNLVFFWIRVWFWIYFLVFHKRTSWNDKIKWVRLLFLMFRKFHYDVLLIYLCESFYFYFRMNFWSFLASVIIFILLSTDSRKYKKSIDHHPVDFFFCVSLSFPPSPKHLVSHLKNNFFCACFSCACFSFVLFCFFLNYLYFNF